MAFTQLQLEALDKAIAEGTLTVKYGDKLVTYRSLEEMLKIRNLMQDELNPDATTEGEQRRIFMKHSKGLRE